MGKGGSGRQHETQGHETKTECVLRHAIFLNALKYVIRTARRSAGWAQIDHRTYRPDSKTTK